MRVYWANREGASAPAHSTFYFHPFLKGPSQSTQLQIEQLPPPARAKALKKSFSPDREQWIEGIEKALDLIRREKLQKIVLARTCTLQLEEAPDPFAIVAALKQKAQRAFVFCFEFEGKAFLGVSPERLYARKERQIISEALAGTRRRGKNETEDLKLQKDLLRSAKELREFSSIPTYLQNTLAPFCRAPLQFTPVSVYKTQNVQHLYAQCRGHLNPLVTDEEILHSLHPTPALCGLPKEQALSSIQELEPFQRGLYGGVIGWSTPEASEWAVAIRSCLIEGKTVTLYSGTGIVEGSDPEKEWEELNHKLRIYDGILDY